MLAFINSYVKNIEDAKDIAQDIFSRLFTIAEKFDMEKCSFKTWLFLMAKNEALNFLKARRETLTLNEEAYEVKDDEKPENELFNIHDLAACLNPIEYRVTLLKYYNDLRLYEIAATLSISESTVKRILRNSAAKIKIYCKENKIHE